MIWVINESTSHLHFSAGFINTIGIIKVSVLVFVSNKSLLVQEGKEGVSMWRTIGVYQSGPFSSNISGQWEPFVGSMRTNQVSEKSHFENLGGRGCSKQTGKDFRSY